MVNTWGQAVEVESNNNYFLIVEKLPVYVCADLIAQMSAIPQVACIVGPNRAIYCRDEIADRDVFKEPKSFTDAMKSCATVKNQTGNVDVGLVFE